MSTTVAAPRDVLRTGNAHSARSDPHNVDAIRDTVYSTAQYIRDAVVDVRRLHVSVAHSILGCPASNQAKIVTMFTAIPGALANEPTLEAHDSKRMHVCLSASLGWAWLQGNSRARRLRSAVPALAGFGFPLRLLASPFARAQNNLLRTLRKTVFARLESGPLRTGSPQRIGARKEDKNMLCKNRITLIGFLGQDAETRSTRTAPLHSLFARDERELGRQGPC